MLWCPMLLSEPNLVAAAVEGNAVAYAGDEVADVTEVAAAANTEKGLVLPKAGPEAIVVAEACGEVAVVTKFAAMEYAAAEAKDKDAEGCSVVGLMAAENAAKLRH